MHSPFVGLTLKYTLNTCTLYLVYHEPAWAPGLIQQWLIGTTMKESIAENKLGVVEELANFATYVLKNYASWLTSEVIQFDGGQLSKQYLAMFI